MSAAIRSASRLPPPIDPALLDAIDVAVLDRAGRREGMEVRFHCPSPTHQDDHPSARWNPAKAVWNCDTCPAGGGAIELARLSGVPLSPPNRNNGGNGRTAASDHRRVSHTTRYAIARLTGEVIAYHMREDHTGGKAMWWEQPDGTRGLNGMHVADLPLFGVDQLPAIPGAEPVVMHEGEKAADAANAHNILSVATITGAAGTPSVATLEALAGFDVYLWPDNDKPGVEHMDRIAARLVEAGIAHPRVIEWPQAPAKGDAADFFAAGGTAAGARELIAAAKQRTWAERPSGDSTEDGDSLDNAPNLVSLADVAPEPLQWLWTGRIPLGKITVLDGDPGLGKSILTLDLIARVTTGASFPDGSSCPSGGAVLLSAEDDLSDTIQPRLVAAGADLTRVVALTSVGLGQDERLPSLPADLAAIEVSIEKVGALLVVIDPLMAYLDADVNSHRDQDVRRVLAQLKELTERTGTAMILVRHLNKSAGGNPIYRGGGSIGIVGAARAAHLVAADPDDEELRVFVPTKANLARKAPALQYRIQGSDTEAPTIQWLGESQHTAATLLATFDQGDQGALGDAKEFLRDVLADGPVKFRDIEVEAKDAGVKGPTLRRAKDALGVTARKYGRPGKGGQYWAWAIPDDDPEGAQQNNVIAFGENDRLRDTDTAKAIKNPEDDHGSGLSTFGGADLVPVSFYVSDELCPDCQGQRFWRQGDAWDCVKCKPHPHVEGPPELAS